MPTVLPPRLNNPVKRKSPMSGHSRYLDFLRQQNPTAANHFLFALLSDDEDRGNLYAELIAKQQILEFESRAYYNDDRESGDDDRPKKFRQKAYLVVHPDHVAAAYRNSDTIATEWSHEPYKDLGGTFMLALDEPARAKGEAAGDPFLSHDAQRIYCYKLLCKIAPAFDPIATVAFKAGASLALKQRNFDLADLAEMVAVNYVARLYGFSQADLPLLKSSARVIGNGLMHVNVGQHFTTDASAIPLAKQELAKLSNRAAELIDLYALPIGKEQCDRQTDLLKEVQELADYWFEDPQGGSHTKCQRLKQIKFMPMMQRMAEDLLGWPNFSTTEKAIMIAGLASGTITNMRAAVCIAIRQFFELKSDDLDTVRLAAFKAYQNHRDASWLDIGEGGEFRAYVEEALRVNPPPPFVPRRALKRIQLEPGGQTIEEGCAIVIAVGGGSWDLNRDTDAAAGRLSMKVQRSVSESTSTTSNETRYVSDCPFSKVFGGRPETVTQSGRAEYLHSCIGKDLAMYGVAYSVRQLMLLPGLTQSLDDSTGEPWGLVKRAGFICERYPMEYEREKLLRQSPLQTVLQVKSPVTEHAGALRQVLQFGAPFIEKVLREARHVHFASFMFLDNDSKLVLFTVYDGDFDGYIGHFAREFGPLFDRFFSHIENGPPAPIAEHAFEFVQFLKRFQQPAVGGLFFSAYPEVQADQIQSHFNKNRNYDFFTMEGAR